VTLTSIDDLRARIREVPDFPKPGILFYDITTLLRDADGFRQSIDALAAPFAEQKIEAVVGMESRGFIFGAAVADRLGAGFIPVRKPGKLPSKTVKASYDLEYGSDALEMHCDAVDEGTRVLVIDDLLATGGTAKATVSLLRGCGADVVGVAFVIELVDLGGRAKLAGENVTALVQY
jgi:adenine phosphoribosyltransferase